jgi:hypothetical protein
MAYPVERDGIELHLVSSVESDELVEILYYVAHYHLTGARLGLHHIVNFGRPWLPGSLCTHGYTSLPYLDGPDLEEFAPTPACAIRCLWLVPITAQERLFAKANGIEALERKFEEAQFEYFHPHRVSCV